MTDVINQLIIRTRRRNPVTSVIVTHDMHSARKVADRVVMLHPVARLERGEPQVVFDCPPSALDRCDDARVRAQIYSTLKQFKEITQQPFITLNDNILGDYLATLPRQKKEE